MAIILNSAGVTIPGSHVVVLLSESVLDDFRSRLSQLTQFVAGRRYTAVLRERPVSTLLLHDMGAVVGQWQ